ncbi:MAG: hypothetical protein K0R39_4165 [Symbiobacteriaceae bacterium]|nr:hypothetical protein [Symbiobacteriaceae bacterium]
MAFDLADLLTAAGQAMGGANRRLAVTGAPALLREFEVELAFDAGVAVPEGAPTLVLTGAAPPNAQLQALFRSGRAVAVRATYVAAPAVCPPAAVAGGCDS